MTDQESRIQSCIDHINTAVDVDPWAKELVAEMGKEILEQLNNSNACISRRAALELGDNLRDDLPDDEQIAAAVMAHNEGIIEYQTKLSLLPSVQPYTDEEIQKMQDIEQAEIEKAFELGQESAKAEIMPDGTLHVTVNADVANIDRILLRQVGTHSGDLYYRDDEKPERQTGKWIPCSDKAPSEAQECWITAKDGTVCQGMFTRQYGERRDSGFICNGFGFAWLNAVAAWMPYEMPEPYREEGE